MVWFFNFFLFFFKMMGYSQLCSLLGMKQEDPEPSPLHTNVVEIQTFLSSPSGKRTKRLV